MLAESSNSAPATLKDANPAAEISWPGRLLLLALNFIALLQLTLIATLAYQKQFALALAALYLVPALVARIIFATGKFPPAIPLGSPAFFRWWTLFQLQVIFNRLPALEEILRFVPGLYSLWLRLWGARIGRLTYWAPGVLISDRSFLNLGHDVVLGAGVRLIPHLIHRNDSGQMQLTLAPITIGDRAVVGGFSILSPGTTIHADQTTRAALVTPPFTIWKNGKRVHD